MNDDRCRARQIVLNVLEEGKYMLRDRYDTAREKQVAGRDAIWKRRNKVAYGKRNVWHCKESGKGVEELAEDSPFPLPSEERDLRCKGVVRLWDESAIGEGSGSGGRGWGGSATRHGYFSRLVDFDTRIRI